jgi:hypothetical protein
MPTKKTTSPFFVICLSEDEQGDSLTRYKIYQVLPDEKASQHGYLRIIDDSGEDYLYASSFFKAISLPREIEQAILEPLAA